MIKKQKEIIDKIQKILSKYSELGKEQDAEAVVAQDGLWLLSSLLSAPQDKTERCPACGSQVKIGGNGETQYYIPLSPAEEERKYTEADMRRVMKLCWMDGLDIGSGIKKQSKDFDRTKYENEYLQSLTNK